MHFEIAHEFEIPLDALELAVLSPDLATRLAAHIPNVEHVTQKEHALKDGVLTRVWSFQANVKIPAFAKPYLTREMCAWDEHTTYRLRDHASSWSIRPHVTADWQKFFSGSGTYELHATPGGSTKRIVRGDVELKVPAGIRQLAERMIVAEVRKQYDAEAEFLRQMATLA